jgi:hypothetical protein
MQSKRSLESSSWFDDNFNWSKNEGSRSSSSRYHLSKLSSLHNPEYSRTISINSDLAVASSSNDVRFVHAGD